MKKIALLFFLFTAAGSFAQGVISVHAGSNFQSVRSASFAEFATSYNKVNVGSLTEKYDPVKVGTGFNIGTSFGYSGLMMGVEYNRVTSHTKAEFDDGAVRHFDLRDQGTAMWFGYNFLPAESKLVFYPQFGITLGRNFIYSTYEPGTSGFTGSGLTGTYESAGGKFFFGATAAAGTEHVKIFCRLNFVRKIASSDLSDSDKIVTDFYNSSIPVDYSEFVNNGPTNYFGENVEDDFRGTRFTLGVQFDLAFGDE